MNKIFITDLVDVQDCTYYESEGGMEYNGLWQYYDACHKYYCHCHDKKFCWYKIKYLLCHPRKIVEELVRIHELKRKARKD